MNDLSAPLGLKLPKAVRRRVPYLALSLSLIFIALAGASIWVFAIDDPLGGEPQAVVRIERGEDAQSSERVAVVGVKSGAGERLPPVSRDAPLPTTGEGNADVADVTLPGAMPGAMSGDASDMASSETKGEMPVQGLPALVEASSVGALPRVGANGVRPVDAYARPVPPIIGASPKVAIVIGGLGLSQTGTHEALNELPPEITLAFAPYGNSLDLWQRRARQDGHELLLQIPLEPFDFPDNDPGPHTLLTDNSADRNLERLHWLMARISAYVGVMNYMGARFTANQIAFEPVLQDLAKRGLLYFDDASSSRSKAREIAGQVGTPFVLADLIIDSEPSDASVDTRLVQLEEIARTRGIAIGYASALPVTIARIKDWASGLENRGITLVPLTAALKRPGG
ncbi:Divergent polysaccharide deacetylase [Hartmannibacter diazotrophicus]|uniref:Divergent polysaccharide deacetylase n=1 Tax=Hartmannibacter diazotrophicus TaxID=1482074 RepID=A0A2C9DCR8_9HYPH|nr:divergent polysaccharide deacetylase family protein [Hartmannibacter diazotrophicus]SON57531.1 Divergent polysaccharide deacetylase [Hartmannibacter diazotrophicus]